MPLLQNARRAAARPLAEVVRFPESPTQAEITRRLLPQCPSLRPWVERLALAAEHDIVVLLTGETGSGKTSLARLIHDCSPRRHGPFVVVPCGALIPHLIESEFFGHVRGAFTGADRNKVGKFAAAGQGTLLLDEIDTLSLDKQAVLLRVLESGEYEPVGSNTTQRSACRVLASSNADLEKLVEQGLFRRDLYYRLKVLSFHLPPLRERTQDIAPLVQVMVARFRTQYRKELFDISPEAWTALESYPWPGNIRELENAVQEAVLISRGPLLLLQDLPAVLQGEGVTANAFTPGALDAIKHNRETSERDLIQRVLASHAYRRSRAARELGISRMTLYAKMKKYGLDQKPRRPAAVLSICLP
jgi:transcriptional regulator with PAS, ATPase and Fis domain